MLTYLKVDDFALIESLELEFRPGFNSLTGETGAGKTVLVGAIGLLLGERGDSMQVRQGASEAVLSCAFDLESLPGVRAELLRRELMQEGEDELILRRTVSNQGKSRCFVNGRLCPVSSLSEIGDLLVEVHGQNTHQALLKPASHLAYLDRFAGEKQVAVLQRYSEAFAGLRGLEREAELLSLGGRGLEREAELLRAECEELERAAPRDDELHELEVEASRLRNVRQLAELGERARGALYSGEGVTASASELLLQAAADLKKMAEHDPALAESAARTEGTAYEAEDLAARLSEYLASLDADPGRLEEVEGRLTVLRQLARKYGGSVASAIAYQAEASQKLAVLQGGRARLAELERETTAARAEAERVADALSEGRRKAAGSFEKAVARQMKQLEMGGARFAVRLSAEPGALTGTGVDAVEFLFAPDPKSEPMPMRRIASGGEMSRVMLAIKIVLAGADNTPVLIFDEVDAGIGGETAVRVGEKLSALTRFHQVFCVTHLPQIASYADWQYQVYKGVGKGGAGRTRAALLDDDGRVEELCRMMGDASGRRVTLEHARDILARAQASKSAGV